MDKRVLQSYFLFAAMPFIHATNTTNYENYLDKSNRTGKSEERGFNHGNSRPPSGMNYLSKVEMNEPKADNSGFKLHLTVEMSAYWDNILDEAILVVDDGFGAEKVLKELERDEFWPKERWVDFTKFSCNSKTKSISICLRDITRHERCVDIPQKFLYGREELMINVESVYPEDRIQLWTRNPDKSHCFSGGSVRINKNGRQVNDADISQLFGQYTFVIQDSSSQSQYSQCSANAGYDFIVTSHHGLSLGSATLSLEQNKISLEEDGKGVRVHSLEAFVPCLSRSATIRELVRGKLINVAITHKKLTKK